MSAYNDWIERAGDRLGQVAAVERVESMVESLSPRDRRLLGALVVFFLLAMTFGGAYVVRGALEKERSQIAYKKDQLLRAQDVLMESQALKGRIDSAEARLAGNEGFIVQSYIERTVQGAGIPAEKLQNIDPRSDIPGDSHYKQTVVEVQLKEVTLESLVNFLHNLEYGDRPIQIKSLKVRAGRRDRADLDVDLELVVVSLNPET